jgi:hypothetical protein
MLIVKVELCCRQVTPDRYLTGDILKDLLDMSFEERERELSLESETSIKTW